MTRDRTAIVLGASGSVGAALMHALIESRAFLILSVARRSQSEQVSSARSAGVELREILLPSMTAESLEAAAREAATSTSNDDVVGLSVLGIGGGTARLSIEQHRAVDVELNVAFARGLAASGHVRHVALMSAVGANAEASVGGSGAAGTSRYNRVKGEAEAAVLSSGIPVVSIFRPSVIFGSQHTPWVLEKLLPVFSMVTPSKFKPIRAQQIAQAMVAASMTVPATSAIYHYPEMMALNR